MTHHTRTASRFGVLASVILAAAMALPARAAGTLLNGNFESGFTTGSYGAVGNSWEPCGRPSLTGTPFSSVYSASTGYFQRMTPPTPGSEAGVCQRITGLTPGRTVSFTGSVYQKVSGVTVWVGIDANNNLPAGALPARTMQVPYVSGKWSQFEATATVGSGGAVAVYVWAYWQSGSSSYVNADDLALADVTSSLTDLAATASLSDAALLQWTAPPGASRYEARYATAPITDSNWVSATVVTAQKPPVPASSGTVQNTWVRGLSAGTRYYFAFKYLKTTGGWSVVSNCASAFTQPQGSAPYWAWATKEKLTAWYANKLADCRDADHNSGSTAGEPDNLLHWYFGGWDPDCEQQPGIGALLMTVRDPWMIGFLGRLSDHVWDLTFANTPLDKSHYNDTYPHEKIPSWNESHHAGECSWNGVSVTAIDYDNPKWIARLVEYARHVHNWTGYTGNPPHLHFKSFWVKVDEWDHSAERGPQSLVDNPEDRRFTRALTYAAWRDPDSRMLDGQTIKDFLYELDTAQADDAMKTDLSKPVGVLPGEIRFDTHQIGGYSGVWWRMAGSLGGDIGTSGEWWWDWRYGFVQSRDAYFGLIDQYVTSGDLDCLAAVRETLRYFHIQTALNYIPPTYLNDPPVWPWPDSNEAWGGYIYIIDYLYRRASRDTQFDPYFLGHANTLWQVLPAPGATRYQFIKRSTLAWDTSSGVGTWSAQNPFFVAWLAGGDKEWLCRSLDEMNSPNDVWMQAMYNGMPTLSINRLPDQPITWNNTACFTNFAALVLDFDSTHVKWLTYNFDSAARRMPIWLWSLQPGDYVVRHGTDVNLDDQMDTEAGRFTFRYTGRRTEIETILPAGRMEVFEIFPGDCNDGHDADGDSTTDCADSCPTDAGKILPGVCGCGVADVDVDSDGVMDCSDACPGTLPGVAVDATGCPLPIPGDMDHDGDVDQEDFGRFQACFTGSSFPQQDPQCQAARLDGDNDVDADDLVVFRRCMTGANVPGDPGCAN